MPLAYIDARDVMERLDSVVGPEHWQDEYTEGPSGRVFCHLTIHGIRKGDGAGATDVEGAKGAISDAFKRAAVKFGIGRYLYDCKSGWVDLENGYLPRDFDGRAFLPAPAFQSKQQKTKYYNGLKDACAEDDMLKGKELLCELTNEQKLDLWPLFTSRQRSLMKEMEAS